MRAGIDVLQSDLQHTRITKRAARLSLFTADDQITWSRMGPRAAGARAWARGPCPRAIEALEALRAVVDRHGARAWAAARAHHGSTR